MKNLIFSKADLKYTFRLLAKKPGSALLSIIVLAGGLGISIFAFTVMYTFFYKEIPLTNGDSIYKICTGATSDFCRPFKTFEFAELRGEISTLDNVGIYYSEQVNITYDESIIDWVDAVQTEWNMFQLSQTEALLGRTLQAYDQDANAEKVAVISYVLWQQLFNGTEEAVGAIATIKGDAVRIVGIMPESYKFPWDMQIWLPMTPRILSPLENSSGLVNAFGLLKAGESVESANTDLSNLMRQIRQRYPEEDGNNDSIDTAHISSFPASIIGGLGKLTINLIISVLCGAIFLLTCINVGTLLLARTNERLKDISIRVALGAPRKRLLFQIMGESIVISIMGGILAVLLAGVGLELFNLLFVMILDQDTIAFWMDFHINSSTLIGAGMFVFFTVMLTSAIPSWRIINGDFNSVMRDGTRGALGLKPGRFSRSLVVASITIITLLLYVGTIFSGELVEVKKSISNNNVNAQIEGLVQANFGLDSDRYSPTLRLQAYRSLRSTLLQQLEFDEFSIIIEKPPARVEIENVNLLGTSFLPSATRNLVLGTSGDNETKDSSAGRVILEGRYVNDFDNNPDNPQIVVITSSLAKTLWPNQSAVGQRLRLVNQQDNNAQAGMLDGEPSPWREVVGVVSDNSILPSIFGFSVNEVFMPLHGDETERVSLMGKRSLDGINSSQNVESSLTVLKQTITALDPSITYSVESIRASQDSIMTALNFIINFAVGCVVFSFLIALAGIYGLVQGSIQMATQEIGTRRALGATDTKITSTYLIRGGKQVLTGFLLAMFIAGFPTYFIIISVGQELIAPMVLLTTLVIFGLYSSIIFAIYYPIKKVLEMEPSEALRYE